METLLSTIGELTALLSPGKVEALAKHIRAVETAPEASGFETLMGTPNARGLYQQLVSTWAVSGLSSDMVAGMLLGASYARQEVEREQSVELVWTGPTTPIVPTRRTEQVLLDVIGSAREKLFLVSFVAHDVSSIVIGLNDAGNRGVKVCLLLESSTSRGGSLAVDPVDVMRRLVPLAALYVWREKAAPFREGRVHAKVAVADDRLAFVTSANLTGHALEKNMEAGVLIRGGRLPYALRSHLDALVETRVIIRT